MEIQTYSLRVHAIHYDGAMTRVIDLRPLNHLPLPVVTAGAHIDVHIDIDTIRQYSLCNLPGETHRYVIGVALDPNSRGGSLWLHKQLSEGDVLSVSAPRNHFALQASSMPAVLIAGGIGVTPLLSMAKQLEYEQRPWTLHFAAKDAQQAPLLAEIKTLAATARFGRVDYYFSRASQPAMNLANILDNVETGSHIYCCGPTRLLADFEQQGEHFPHLHYFSERFSTSLDVAKGGYTIVLARSGKTLFVREQDTILKVLKTQRINVPYACGEGVCGSCEIKLIAGDADHRDAVLSDAEKQRNESIMVCCSGALSDRLVLDL